MTKSSRPNKANCCRRDAEEAVHGLIRQLQLPGQSQNNTPAPLDTRCLPHVWASEGRGRWRCRWASCGSGSTSTSPGLPGSQHPATLPTGLRQCPEKKCFKPSPGGRRSSCSAWTCRSGPDLAFGIQASPGSQTRPSTRPRHPRLPTGAFENQEEAAGSPGGPHGAFLTQGGMQAVPACLKKKEDSRTQNRCRACAGMSRARSALSMFVISAWHSGVQSACDLADWA